jgi:hypothetical protein
LEYIRYEFNTKKLGLKESCVRLYPLVCMHVGAAQCDMEFITEHIERLRKDPNGKGIYLGDGGECVTRLSKGGIYEQLLSPQQQHDVIVEMLDPVKDKLLFGIRGNHGHRIYKETGLSFDKNLCHRLGIPYLGVSAFCNLVVNRSSYDLFLHHGSDSGTGLQSKVTKAENFGRFVQADALLTAHSHICVEMPPMALLSANNNSKTIKTQLRHQYICGCGYDSRSGYAEEKAYPPILPAYMVIAFDGRIIEGTPQHNQQSKIYRSDGQHELKHDYIYRKELA